MKKYVGIIRFKHRQDAETLPIEGEYQDAASAQEAFYKRWRTHLLQRNVHAIAICPEEDTPIYTAAMAKT